MKIDIIYVYDRAIKILKHNFPTKAHRTFKPRPMKALSLFDAVLHNAVDGLMYTDI